MGGGERTGRFPRTDIESKRRIEPMIFLQLGPFRGFTSLAFTGVFLLCAGCAAVGPDYVKPKAALSTQWNAGFTEGLKAGNPDPRILARWWECLDDPVLSGLIERVITGNLDLAKAKSRIRKARANRTIAKAGFFPTVNVTDAHAINRSSEQSGGGVEVETHSTGLDASWELDLFGGVRREVEAAEADLNASREDLHDVLVSMVAEAASSYVDVRTYQARLAVAEKNLQTQEETWQLTRSRGLAGLTADLAVQQAKYNLENTRSQIPALRASLDASMNRLAVLLGEQPGAVHLELQTPKPIPVTPLEIAVGVPADILRQRPDVRRAERELAAETARVGVAVADLYPKLTLSGSIGVEALSFSDLFLPGSHAFSFGPGITFPLFNAGSLRAKVEVQSAVQEQALKAYEASILAALEEVENALVSYAREQEKRRSLIEAAEAARAAAVLAENQYTSGMISFSDVLEAQRSLLSFEDLSVQSTGAVTSDLIRIYKALGGGWTPLAENGAHQVSRNHETN